MMLATSHVPHRMWIWKTHTQTHRKLYADMWTCLKSSTFYAAHVQKSANTYDLFMLAVCVGWSLLIECWALLIKCWALLTEFWDGIVDASMSSTLWAPIMSTYEWVMAHIWMSHVTHMSMSSTLWAPTPCGSQGRGCPMGWLRSEGSIELEVSFTKEPYKRDDILQKRRVI